MNPNIQTSDDALLNSFSTASNKNEIAEVLKELFDLNKIHLITDLTKDEIKLITRILMIADLKNLPIWHDGINYFLKLVLSKNRASRKELLEAIRGHPMQQGFFNRMNPFNRMGGGRI